MDGIKDGDTKTYFYALFDDGSGNFGLMNQNGTPMAAGTAIHNLTTLLSDTGASASTFTTGSLNYTLSGKASNDNTLLFQKSDGTYWISLWNEVDTAHNVTVNLPTVATDIKTFDPLTGTAATKDVKNASSVTVRMTDHPLLVEVVPSGTTPGPTSPPTVTTGSGSDSLVLHMAEDAYQGDAQFTVSIDNKQLGGTFTTTALQSAGVTQDFIFNGNWAVGSHTVTVRFLNDASGGTATTDRNLYVDGAVYDGVNTGKTAALLSAGPWSFTVNDTTPISTSPPTLQPNDLVINVPASGDTVTALYHVHSAWRFGDRSLGSPECWFHGFESVGQFWSASIRQRAAGDGNTERDPDPTECRSRRTFLQGRRAWH